MRLLFPFLGLLLSAVAAAGCAKPRVGSAELAPRIDAYISSLPDDWGAMSVEELNDQMRSRTVFIVDVRDAPEVRNEGHIAGSINIPVRTLLSNLGKVPDKAQPIVVICSSGHRSALAMAALQLLGYTNVKALTGGLYAWKRAKLPIETGTPPGADRLTSLRAWISRYIPSSRSSEPGDELFDALAAYRYNLPNSLDSIPPPMLNDLLSSSKPLQLDVRDAVEVAARGAIRGATNIPLRTLIRNLDKLPPDRRALIITECEDGHRAALAMLALHVLGYGNVRTLMGGLAAWTKADLPLAS
jgi:rhodanese-related sulfurtransferase